MCETPYALLNSDCPLQNHGHLSCLMNVKYVIMDQDIDLHDHYHLGYCHSCCLLGAEEAAVNGY